jgi:hypothetical protein
VENLGGVDVTVDNQRVETPPAAGWGEFGRYALYWTVLGGVGGLFTPVIDEAALDQFWWTKLDQVLSGIVFGLFCFAAFAALQHFLNAKRRRWLTWTLALSTWMGMKVVLILLSDVT